MAEVEPYAILEMPFQSYSEGMRYQFAQCSRILFCDHSEATLSEDKWSVSEEGPLGDQSEAVAFVKMATARS
jgi:hypothetical protein